MTEAQAAAARSITGSALEELLAARYIEGLAFVTQPGADFAGRVMDARDGLLHLAQSARGRGGSTVVVALPDSADIVEGDDHILVTWQFPASAGENGVVRLEVVRPFFADEESDLRVRLYHELARVPRTFATAILQYMRANDISQEELGKAVRTQIRSIGEATPLRVLAAIAVALDAQWDFEVTSNIDFYPVTQGVNEHFPLPSWADPAGEQCTPPEGYSGIQFTLEALGELVQYNPRVGLIQLLRDTWTFPIAHYSSGAFLRQADDVHHISFWLDGRAQTYEVVIWRDRVEVRYRNRGDLEIERCKFPVTKEDLYAVLQEVARDCEAA